MSGVVRSLAAVDGQCFQQANPGGLRRLFAILKVDVVGNYPKAIDFDEDGVTLKNLPTLRAGAKWVEYVVPDGTSELSIDDSNDPGYMSYKHTLDFALAGSSKALHSEMGKFLNAGALYFVEDKDGNYILTGSTDDPHFTKKPFKTGKKGNDKRGYTAKSEVDGLTFGWNCLAEAKKADLEVDSVTYTFPEAPEPEG